MPKGNSQFDPVAASATAALNATQRTIRSVQREMDAPEAPAQNQVFSQGRNVLSTVSELSPVNVLVRGNGPAPQGNPLEGALPSNLPGMDALPPTPQGLPGPDANGGRRKRKKSSSSSSNGGSNGGSSGRRSGGGRRRRR